MALLVLAGTLVAVSCGGSGAEDAGSGSTSTTAVDGGRVTTGGTPRPTPSTDRADSTETTDQGSTSTMLPAGAEAGLDDYDGDGQPDPTCGSQDFGAGLALRIPCLISTPNEPEDGSELVEGSLYRLPGSTDIDLDGISGSLLLARDVSGRRVRLVVFNSDNLFATGSDEIGSTDTMDNTISLINRLYPGAAIQVRGHTDSTGAPDANQALSETRAANVRGYLLAHGVVASGVTAVGLGEDHPLARDAEDDGSVDEDGQRFNRRVEVVLRLP